MIVKVKGYANMRKYTDHLSSEGEMEITEGTTVGGVLNQLGVPSDVKKVIMVNGRSKIPEFVLQPEDILVFFPPLEGG